MARRWVRRPPDDDPLEALIEELERQQNDVPEEDLMTENVADKPWWKATRYPSLDGHFHQGWANIALALQALEGGLPVRLKNISASLKDGDNIDAFLKRLQEAFPDLRLIEIDQAQNRKAESEWTFVADHGALKIHFDGDSRTTATIVTRAPVFIEAFTKFFEDATTKTIPKGRVHVLITTNDGPEFKSMGVGGQALERGNYSDEVLRGYDRIVKDLGAAVPAGRVAILDGKPGTGKTFLVRGLLDEVKDVIMIIVPANLVVQLAQPGMIPALVALHQERGERPMVFIIEDADECLAPRMGDNMSSVSTILNLGDGILGQLLDIRIVATTNAHRQELDEAIMRPGRLSASVNVGPLPYDKAKAVFDRLAPGKVLKEKSYTLAEVYSQARDEGWEPPKKDKNKMGFGAQDEDDDDPYDY
jgi:hypothetical protein